MLDVDPLWVAETPVLLSVEGVVGAAPIAIWAAAAPVVPPGGPGAGVLGPGGGWDSFVLEDVVLHVPVAASHV